jgi:hypothetical protein
MTSSEQVLIGVSRADWRRPTDNIRRGPGSSVWPGGAFEPVDRIRKGAESPRSVAKREASGALGGSFGSHPFVLAVFAVCDAVEGLSPARL